MPRKKKLCNRPHWLYFLLQDRKVIYIGVTSDLKSRIYSHRRKQFNAVRVFKFDWKWAAITYEQRWISRLRPALNIAHNHFGMIGRKNEASHWKEFRKKIYAERVS